MFSKKNIQVQAEYDTLQIASHTKVAFPATFDTIKEILFQEVLLKQVPVID
ncbi:hypothetical protein [Xanthocytophaga flava]|uniref:hypothetical protein n=1 Tax=Xanthocytophaga flava TaxID=3048013 RepID=UPI0028D6A811|nr:hypothetical protein [Xanthocytophaga flavus]MDJ1473332.1 hypothetical protein [Xanthocytophaga flavus]